MPIGRNDASDELSSFGSSSASRSFEPEKKVKQVRRSLFGFSLLYLFGIFAAYLADAVVQRAVATWI